ncbi:MAG TPA: flagellar hook-associated protein FlgK [Firmicutes bacterium]|nr:flagellar hook-associated protein FlgK [Bacillota bacterium]
MSTISTFGAFTTARLGMTASMMGLNVTGNNIANINTSGYTRQVVDQISLKLNGPDRYANNPRVGQGTLVTGISQLRDPYLDIRFRDEQSSVGAMDSKLSALEQIAAIIDEVAKGDGNGMIEKQINDLIQQLQSFNTENASKEEFDSLVRSSASALCTLFNNYAKDLEGVRDNLDTSFRQDLTHVNELLENIRNLNESIRNSEIHGDSALEMKDQRNTLIDELSQYMKIDVIYSQEPIGAGKYVQKLTIKLADDSQTTLVDGNYGTQLSIRQEPKPNPDYDGTPGTFKYLKEDGTGTNNRNLAAKIDSPDYSLDYSALVDKRGRVLEGSAGGHLAEGAIYGSLQASREMLTAEGEFAVDAGQAKGTVIRGIPYYQKALDALANQFAEVMNEANQPYRVDSEGYYLNENGNRIQDNNGTFLKKDATLTEAQRQILTEQGQRLGKVLFSNSNTGDDTTGITAANISISNSWSTGASRITTTAVINADNSSPSTANDNLTHILAQFTTDFTYRPSDLLGGDYSDTPYFTGTFQEKLADISSILGNDMSTTTTMLENYYSAALEIDTSRDAVSGVDLNDEAANLMQYQKSYAAACRLMTTLDEALDKLINDTGIVGR